MSMPFPSAHRNLIDRLRDPAVYSQPTDRVEVAETHISVVFLVGPYAYKIKKPVNMGFLDYTKLESRRFYSYEEVRLNRRLAPDVYLGVAPIVERRGRLRLGGVGRIREYAVWMRRLPADRMMDRLLAAGLVERHHVEVLADVIARFHASVEPAIPAEGAPSSIARVVRENLAQVEPFVGRILSPERYRTLAAAMQHFLSNESSRLAARAAGGRTREGHGDLRPENICLEARPVIFDCIEFSRRLRVVDVAADIAFLSMELAAAGRADLARHFVDAYVDASGDPELRTLLDFYQCARAVVRGKVLSLRLSQLDPTAPETARLRHRAESYFTLAEQYASALGNAPPQAAGADGRYGRSRDAEQPMAQRGRQLGPSPGISPGSRGPGENQGGDDNGKGGSDTGGNEGRG